MCAAPCGSEVEVSGSMATIASAVRRAERVRVLRSTVCEPDEFDDPKIVLI